MFSLMNIVFRPLGSIVSDIIYKHTNSVWAKKPWLLAVSIIMGCFELAIGLTDTKHDKTMFALFTGLAAFIDAANGANFSMLPHVHPFANGILSVIVGVSVHVITDPDLLSVMHRHSSISFEPLVVAIAESIVGDSPNILKLMHAPPGADGVNHYMFDTHASLHKHMFPGPTLWSMNARALHQVAEMVTLIGCDIEERSLWYWLRDSITRATSEALFGIHHPLGKDPSLVQAVWDSNESQITMIFLFKALRCVPQFIRRFFVPHSKIRSAFLQFYSDPANYKHHSVSSLVKARIEANLKHNVPMIETGNSAHSLLFVATTNAVPTIFWTTLLLFSNLTLVSEFRGHLENSGIISFFGTTVDGKRKLRIDYTKFNQNCPCLVEAYNEAVRLTNMQSGARVTLEDCVLGAAAEDKTKGYFLQKGSLILATSRITHLSPKIWGEDAKEFRTSRWQKLTKLQKRAFVPFGGGKHLCPGREFAFVETVGTMAVLLLGFEIVGKNGKALVVPKEKEMKFGVVGSDAKGKALRVGVRRWVGWEDVVWEFGRDAGEVMGI